MPSLNRGMRFTLLGLGILIVLFVGSVLVLLSVPRFRWRLEIVQLKATGGLSDLTWKELVHLNRHGDPFNLKGLVNTPSSYLAIKNPFSSAEDVSAGESIFQSNCTLCHGSHGVGGGAGPALEQHQMRKGSSDWAVFKTISNGIAGTAMPPSTLSENDRWKLVAYVKSLAAGAESRSDSPLIAQMVGLGPVRYEDILASGGDPHRWLTYSGTYDGHRFSPNDQITTANVSKLRLLWMRQYTTTSETLIETNPLIVDGYMFITVPPNRVEALDAKTGALIWSYDRELPERLSLSFGYVNRGLAVMGNLLFFGTLDAHLIALDMRTGRVSWDVAIADYKAGYSISGAPLALKNMVVTGVAGGEFGIRGFVDARDTATGKEIWRFNTIPQPGQVGSETWEAGALTGGGPTWLTGTFDPELNLLYWPVGNPSPNYNGNVRKGDNLYTDSVVALDADQGKLRWYFQFTPHDVFDWDATETLVSFDKTVAGKRYRLLGQANRNAFYYVLDRENGSFHSASPIAKQTWASGIDTHGRPVMNPAAVPSPEGSTVFPSVGGATNWISPSYSPLTDLMYVPVREWGGIFYSATPQFHRGELFLGGSSEIFDNPPPKGVVRALDASTGETRWEYRKNTTSIVGGLLSTKGGVVFGSVGQSFFALDAQTGRELWRIDTGGLIKAAPVTYSIDGKQMVTIAAGHDLLTFGL
jgi:alcohol dehydrogenase (cytochrome c)